MSREPITILREAPEIQVDDKSLAFIGNASAHDSRGEDAGFEPRRFR